MKNRFYYFLFLFLFSTNLFSFSYQGSFINLKNEFDDYKKISFKLTKLTFNSDINFSDSEFFYLVNLKTDELSNFKDVNNAYKQLMGIKRFKTVDIKISEYKKGIWLHFDLKANWMFKKLMLRGIWFDKYKYEELYLQQPGDIFDISLHEESVQAIKKLMYDNGFFNGRIIDEFVYEKVNKLVTVRINIDRGNCFKIEEVNFDFKKTENKNDILDILEKLKKILNDNLLDFSYSKSSIEKQVYFIRSFLRKKGYINNRVKVRRLINKNTNMVKIFFVITLNKRLRIKFQGNKFFSKDQLKQEVINDDKPFWLLSPQIIAEQLILLYYKKGFWKISIDYEVQSNGIFLFKIKEGSEVLVDSVEVKFLNNKSNVFEIRNNEKNLYFKELLKYNNYDETLLNSGLQNLKKSYIEKGFWDFKILEKEFISTESDKYKISILADTGLQRFYGGCKIKNFEYLQEDNFFKKYKDNLPFNVSWISEQRFFLLNYFQKKGYWYVDVQPELETLEDKVYVSWKIILGKRVKFGKILLRGNTKLPFRRILKELRFKQGEVWSKTKLDLTSARFKALDLFKVVQFQPYKVSKVSGVKPVILTLVDDDPYELRFRLGYFLTSKNFLLKQQSTYKIGSSFIFKNPTNSADKLSLNADITRFERYLNIDYQLPSPFGLPIISKAKAYANKYVQPVEIGKSGSAYEAIQNGFLVGLRNEYKENYFWGLNLGNEWMETCQVRGNLKLAPELIDKTVPYFFSEPSLVIDTLDDRINATKGTLTFLSLKIMIPYYRYAETTFKVMVEQAFLKPIFGEVIGGFHFRWGHIFRQDFEYIMPIERFYLGGPHSVRGYEIDSLPPLGVSEQIEDGKVEKLYSIQGGSSMLNGNLELRFPIFRAFKGVIFQDIGVLSQSGFSGFKGTWYPGTGFGFRYKTPIGPVRFDIGWKWKKRFSGDCPYAWYLTIGEAF